MKLKSAIYRRSAVRLTKISDLYSFTFTPLLIMAMVLICITFGQKSHAGDWDESLNLTSRLVNSPIFNTQMRLYFANENNHTLPSLTLIHGVGGSAQDFAELVPLLAKSYKLILVDLPGYGDSAHSTELYSSANYAKNLAIILPGVVNRTNSIIGHSMGGNIALQLVEMAPHLAKRLILIDAAGMLHKYSYSKYVALNQVSDLPFISQKHQNKLAGWIDKVNRFIPDFTDILLSGPSRTHILKDNSVYISAISVMHENLTDTLRNIHTPTLIIWGKADPVMPYHTGIMLNYILTNSQFELLNDLGHSPQKEASQAVYHLISHALQSEDFHPNTKLDRLITTSQSDQDYVLDCDTSVVHQLNNLDYNSIAISNCENLEIDHISTKQITVVNSNLVLNNLVIINPDNTAITSVQSNLTIWGGKIVAKMAMDLSTTNIDLNGVDIRVGDTPYIADKDSQILASVSLLKQGSTEQHWHGFVKD